MWIEITGCGIVLVLRSSKASESNQWSLSTISAHLCWHTDILSFSLCVYFPRCPWRWQSPVASLGDPCLSLTSVQLPLLVFESSSRLSWPDVPLSSPLYQIYFSLTIIHLSLSVFRFCYLSVSPSPTSSPSLHLYCIYITMETKQLLLLPAPSSCFHSIRIRGQRLEPQTGLHQLFFFLSSSWQKKIPCPPFLAIFCWEQCSSCFLAARKNLHLRPTCFVFVDLLCDTQIPYFFGFGVCSCWIKLVCSVYLKMLAKTSFTCYCSNYLHVLEFMLFT